MHQHWNPIARELNINFDCIGSHIERPLNSKERILRKAAGEPSMRNNLHF